MSETDLRTRIKEMLVKNLMLQITPDQIGDDLPLFGSNGLGLDSIDALELVVSMEKTFGVGVPSSEVAGKALRTVNTIHDYILEKQTAPSYPATKPGSRCRSKGDPSEHPLHREQSQLGWPGVSHLSRDQLAECTWA